MKLYDYYRSSASYRVRIALNLKQLDYEKESIHLLNHGGEHHMANYKNLNPQGLVPAFTNESGQTISQSLAIIEYLEDCYPTPALLPADALGRAEVRSMALLVTCDIHPLNNLRVLNRLRHQFSAAEDEIVAWMHHWLHEGFTAFEQKLQRVERNSGFCYGDEPGLADICLIPQVYNARRFHLPMEPYPLINQIDACCKALPAFQRAAPKEPENIKG